MKRTTLTGITVLRGRFSFRMAFSHNLATRTGTETLLVRVSTDNGPPGYGQALPREYLTGETVDSAEKSILTRWGPLFQRLTLPSSTETSSSGTPFSAFQEAFQALYETADAEKSPAAYSAVDIAATAAFANAGAVAWPDHACLGPKPLVGVITAGGVRKAYWLARILYLLGYRFFKIKVGLDAEADTRRVLAVKKAVGNGCTLFADANAAWDIGTAERRISELGRMGIRVVEEPFSAEARGDADWQAIERSTGVELMADESIVTRADAGRLLERGGPSWWNLRLAKNGGFTGVGTLARMARENGVRVYAGILVGESGALAAAGQGAMHAFRAECGEYGFSRVFLRDDPFRGTAGGYRGTMAAPGTNGLFALRVIEPVLEKNFRVV